jgi:hypothetical protein
MVAKEAILHGKPHTLHPFKRKARPASAGQVHSLATHCKKPGSVHVFSPNIFAKFFFRQKLVKKSNFTFF